MASAGAKSGPLKQGQIVALVATLATLILAILKFVVGSVFNSKILIADAVHSSADLLAISASGFGLWLASKQKSKKFPYGLYKAETLASLFIGTFIAWAGVEMLQEGHYRLTHIAFFKDFPTIPACASLLSMGTAYWIARKERSVGRAIGSQSLLANASESMLDIVTSLVVLMGIVLSFAQIPYVEGVVILFISVLILKVGLENVWKALLILLDANLDPVLQSEIQNKINDIYGVKGVSEVQIRQSGPFKMVECKIKTSPTLPLYRAHELANKTEDFIQKNYNHIESVFIHVEPLKTKAVTAIIPVKDVNGMDSKVYGHFGRSPYFIILRLNEGQIEIEDFYSNEFLNEKKHIGIKVIKSVIQYKLDLVFTAQIGEISFYMLKENFVDIYRIEDGLSVKEIIDRYRNNQLQQIISPTHSLEDSEVQNQP